MSIKFKQEHLLVRVYREKDSQCKGMTCCHKEQIGFVT